MTELKPFWCRKCATSRDPDSDPPGAASAGSPGIRSLVGFTSKPLKVTDCRFRSTRYPSKSLFLRESTSLRLKVCRRIGASLRLSLATVKTPSPGAPPPPPAPTGLATSSSSVWLLIMIQEFSGESSRKARSARPYQTNPSRAEKQDCEEPV